MMKILKMIINNDVEFDFTDACKHGAGLQGLRPLRERHCSVAAKCPTIGPARA
jgi:hypothetical protein